MCTTSSRGSCAGIAPTIRTRRIFSIAIPRWTKRGNRASDSDAPDRDGNGRSPEFQRKIMLKIENLHVRLEEEDKAILKGVDLSVGRGEVHAIMGPNGSGKSTLSYVLAGRNGYEVTDGAASLDGSDILGLEPEERAAAGLFLAFQYPIEIPGVGNMTFLRTALNAQRKARGEEELNAADFLRLVREKAKALAIDAEMLKRPVNMGFSGGEKKRNEIL